MKKSLFMLAVAAAALSSCVKSQVVEVADNMAIGFDTYVGKHTRSTTVVINGRSDLKTFYVFGNAKATDESTEEVFDLQKVYWSGTNAQDGHYEYNNGVSTMWETNKTYYFAAVSNGNAILDNTDPNPDPAYDLKYDVDVAYTYAGSAGDANKITITNYTVNDKDLIVDIADPIESHESMTGRETVTFDFRHLLTRVRFVVNNGDALGSNSIVAVEDLNFTGTKTADCDYTWTNLNTHNISWSDPVEGTYEYTPDDVLPTNDTYVITPSSNKSFGKFVIPQSNQNINVSFSLVTYKVEDDGLTKTYTETNRAQYTYPLKYDNDTNPSDDVYDFTWHAGKVYQYTVTVAGTINYIRFDANVAAWNFDLDGNGTANTEDDIIMSN